LRRSGKAGAPGPRYPLAAGKNKDLIYEEWNGMKAHCRSKARRAF
jgi:hypothetical protein